MLLPIQIETSGPALATGKGRIVKLAIAVSGPHSLEIISLIVCNPVEVKLTTGFDKVDVAGTPPLNVQL